MKIFEFCIDELEKGPNAIYGAQNVTSQKVRLLELAKKGSEKQESHFSNPGKFQPDKPIKDRGEKAFQRALCCWKQTSATTRTAHLTFSWKDYELPVYFKKGQRRRPSVDLIGQEKNLGCFLCELKYTSKASQNDANYAILEALIYFGFVEKNQGELELNVKREGSQSFSWKGVVESKTIVVAANARFWVRQNKSWYEPLLTGIKRNLGITVLLFQTPDYEDGFGTPEPGQETYIPTLKKGFDHSWKEVT